MWFRVVCTLIDSRIRVITVVKILLWTVMTRIVVDKSTDHAKVHYNRKAFLDTRAQQKSPGCS